VSSSLSLHHLRLASEFDPSSREPGSSRVGEEAGDIGGGAEIRRLHRAEGLPIWQIAKLRGISRNTVRAAVRSDGPPRYERAAKGSVADGFEPRIRSCCGLQYAVDGDRGADRVAVFDPDVERAGWRSCGRHTCRRIRRRGRNTYAAGELAQCDFGFPDVQVPVGFGQVRTAKQLSVLTMVCGYSRWAAALLVPSRCAEDLFAGADRRTGRRGPVPCECPVGPGRAVLQSSPAYAGTGLRSPALSYPQP
jgi:hypothetical protein